MCPQRERAHACVQRGAEAPCRNPFCRCDERTRLCVVPTLIHDSASGAENWCNSKVGQLMSHFWAVAVIKLLCGAQLVRSRWQLSCLRVARCITGGSPCMRHQSTDQQRKKRLSPNIRFSWSYVHVHANSLNMRNETCTHMTQHKQPARLPAYHRASQRVPFWDIMHAPALHDCIADAEL